MARYSMRRSLALGVSACAVVALGAGGSGATSAAAASGGADNMNKWAGVLANAFMASGSPDKAVQNIAHFQSLMADEMSSQGKKWTQFQSKCIGADCGIDIGSDIAKLVANGTVFSHPLPEISISDPVFFTDGTANVSTAAQGVSLSSSFFNYAPCLVALSETGAGVFPQGFNIQPQIFGANPQAVNIQPQAISVAPTLLLVAPIAANIQPQGFTVAPTFLSISPIRTVISKVGPVNVAPTLISVKIPGVGDAPGGGDAGATAGGTGGSAGAGAGSGGGAGAGGGAGGGAGR